MGHEGHDHDHDDHGHGHRHGQRHSHSHGPAGEHRAHSPAQVSVFVVTCSDSRDEGSDLAGAQLVRLLQGAGHTLAGRAIVREEPERILAALHEAVAHGARAVIFTGGTGVSRRDVTVDTLQPCFERHLPGFGELLRALSFREVGSAAWLSRACAGTYRGAAVFLLPGSPSAVQLALEQLILPELGHLVHELSR